MMLFDIVLEENDKKDSWKHDISELNVLNTIFYIYYLYFLYNFRLFLWIHIRIRTKEPGSETLHDSSCYSIFETSKKIPCWNVVFG